MSTSDKSRPAIVSCELYTDQGMQRVAVRYDDHGEEDRPATELERHLLASRSADSLTKEDALKNAEESRQRLASRSSALPTEPPIEALDAMSNGVILHIVQRAPAPDMGVLRERQRMVWRDVLAALGKVQTPSASEPTCPGWHRTTQAEYCEICGGTLARSEGRDA